ncbi:hypothetical protein HF896_02510 [Alicycliphilus denitrificans]|uniref:DUF927 domain-containing protein n=1 Tax=Alicycliphilus denitrificans TaxID=179636 RepID=A0A858ZP00_9BURK|nr:hypothetical protein [Alicycliphilus denitrificans]QKD42543.1 hypothetical protein HF896_02510 [Alicycliphilus denitrificans]
MNKTILSTTGTPLNQQDSSSCGGYIALGMVGNKFAVFSLLNKQVQLLSPSDLKEMNLKALFGALWCELHYNEFDAKKEEVVFNHKRLATDILSACQAAGPYSETAERRVGVWKMSDGQLVVNGRQLWRADGTVLEHGIHEGRVYPVSGDVGFDLSTPMATREDVNQVLAAFNSPQWIHPMAGEIVLGFFGMSLVSTALRRRPHVLMTGPAACGKSTVLEYVRWLLGSLAYGCTGPQTMAAFYQSLAGTSKVVVNDEFEADPGKKGCKDTFEVARMSYSLQEGDEGIVRGTVTGKSKSYRFYSPFIAAGISPGKMEPADLTRWVILEAKGKPQGEKLTEAQAREFGPRLARLFISRWNVFQASEDVVRHCILSLGGDGRMADTVGTLLASYWAFVSESPATEEDAKFLVSMLGIEGRIAVHQVSDELQCLEALTSRVLPFKVVDGAALVTRHLSIAQAIEMVCKDPTGQPELVMRLAQMGLRVALAKGKWSLYVVNSPMHQELRKLFAGTKWATGGWSVVLRRLPGGEESTQRIGAGLGAAKVTVVDVPEHLLLAGNEDDMLLAA